MSHRTNVSGSFRDPSGFVFVQDGVLYRQVDPSYRQHYDRLLSSGLYAELVAAGLLVPHEEAARDDLGPGGAYKIIRPEPLPFLSYPYEWCFSQLQDAALATLRIQRQALDKGMVLKDASAYNIQFHRGRPVLIDTLSFEQYHPGKPWIAYRQFCQHFFAPLALMCYTDVRLSQLLRVYIDGIPLDLASALLPWRTRFNFALMAHLHLHARSQRYFADKPEQALARRGQVSRLAMVGLVDNLEAAVRRMAWRPPRTEWGAYYEDTNYTAAAREHKEKLVSDFLDRLHPRLAWDLGANTGLFSRLASDKGILTISSDVDPLAVEKNYRESVARKETHILPLVLDLTNPSAGIGWQNEERTAFLDRGPADVVLALALVHHLAISNNLPWPRLAEFFHRAGRALIVEFVPKSDSQVQRLLASRADIFPDYTPAGFENAMGEYFIIQEKIALQDSQRVLYLMTVGERG